MKIIQFMLIVFMLLPSILIAEEINFKYLPGDVYAGSLILIMEDGSSFMGRSLIDVQWDGTSNLENVIVKTRDFIKYRIPVNASVGEHSIFIQLDDNVFGGIMLTVKEKQSVPGDTVNGYDPNPSTQNGLPVDRGSNPIGIIKNAPVKNPSGGHGNYAGIPCDSLHKVDGMFTDSIYKTINEWESIVPLHGQFSNLYLDYCGTERTLYLMNDWILGNGNYDSVSCYNLFEFITGDGREKWHVKVWNTASKGVEVTRNGVVVTNDTNYVIGGSYGYNSSPLEEEEHTMWEFGLKVESGLYIMRLYKDEVGMIVTEPNVKIICDEGGVEGYGLVQAPEIVTGYLGSDGSLVNKHARYIPISGVAGLVTEPSEFAGVLKSDSATIRIDARDEMLNLCNQNHTIDGLFTEADDEWASSQPAIGKYSNLYAEYCDGILYILNDWVLADQEPDEKNCYNLFELFTGDGAEHWGIFVYHDSKRGIKVFRNGEDVSDSSEIVLGGAFGFDSSLLMEEKHTIYEFAIKAQEGAWHLFLCDPGPASFCDLVDEDAPRAMQSQTGIRKITDDSYGTPGDHLVTLKANRNDTLSLAFGSKIDFSDYFVRKFKLELKYDIQNFLPVSVDYPQSNGIADEYLSLTLNFPTPGVAIIEGVASSNFQSSGDLFVLKGIPLFQSKELVKLKSSLNLGNRTTYMYRDGVPTLELQMSDSSPVHSGIESLLISPNPIVDGRLRIELSVLKNDYTTIELYDLSGYRSLICERKLVTSGINVIDTFLNKKLASGTYFLKIHLGEKVRLYKIIILNR